MSGRQDEQIPWMSHRTAAQIQLGAFALAVLVSWQAAVAWSTPTRFADLAATARAIAKGHPLAGVGGNPSTVVLFVLLLGGLATLWVGGAYARARWRTRTRRGKGMAVKSEVDAKFGVDAARAKAGYLRPGLVDAEKADVAELGFVIGTDPQSGEDIVVSYDDHVCVLAPTGAGKSRDVLIPAAQTAPGALIVTTNEATIVDALAPVRSGRGRIWVFDPLERTHWPEPMVWDAVAGCTDADRANARGSAFCAGIAAGGERSGNEAFFVGTATTAMETMLHAAALNGGSMSDVLRWALDMSHGVDVPASIISTSKHPSAEPMWESALRGVATGADDTVASTRTTLQSAIKPMLRRSVLRWVDPVLANAHAATVGDSTESPTVPVFDPEAFITSTDTLVLVSDDNASTDVGPLCAMLFQEVIDALKLVATTTAGQRIDPPIRIAGDEIANVAPLPKLPEIATEVRKLGCQMVLAFQDDGQAVSRWGKERGMKLLTQMGAEIVLPGVKAPDTLERYSKLTGEVDVIEQSSTFDMREGRSSSVGVSRHVRPVMRPHEVRTMPDMQGLLIYRNMNATLVRTIPWWERPGGEALREQMSVEAAARAERAQEASKRRRALAATGVEAQA